MLSILQSEWYKLRKSKIVFIIFVGPLVGFFLGLVHQLNIDIDVNEWYLSLFSMTLTYSLLFLPFITGILATAICRYEHQAGGWVATLPLIALQLWMSILFKSFAAPFTVNVIFTLPSILAVNSERFGPFYPWAQPFLMMYIGADTGDVFFVPWEQLLTVVGGSFVIFFFGGYLYFQRKMI